MNPFKHPEQAEKPVQEIRFGRIKVSLWAGRSDHGMRYNATVCRLYRDGEAWKTSDSFGREELPLVIKALDLAHTWIVTNGASGAPTRSDAGVNGAHRSTEGGRYDGQ